MIYHCVSWSHDADATGFEFQYFVERREAVAFARELRVDPRRGWVKLERIDGLAGARPMHPELR